MEDVRAGWLFPVLAVAALVALTGLLYLNSYKNFYYDEWDFISAYRPGQTGTSVFFPHGEHWSTVPILIWKGLFVLFGIRSHLPYQAIVVVAHVANALLLFAFIRRRAGDVPAFGAALIFLFLGTGASNIVQAFQGNQTLSMAFGLLALLAIDVGWLPSSSWRIAAISALLLLSLMSSGLGLGFVVAIGVQLFLDSRRRHLLLALALPIAIYLMWFFIYGKGGSPCVGCPSALGDLRAAGPSYLLQVANFVTVGVAASVIGLFGVTIDVPPGVVQSLVAGFAVLLVWHFYVQRRIESWELGLLAGLMAQFALIGLARVEFGVRGAADPRYVYTGTVYLLPLGANAVKHLSWHLLLRPMWIGGVALIVISNAALLAEQSLAWTDLMRTENAELRVVELFRGAPDMVLNQPLDEVVMPQLTAARYYGAIDEMGSPIPSSTPTSLDDLPPRAVDNQLVALFGGALHLTPQSQANDVVGPCQTVDSASGSTMYTQASDLPILIDSEAGGMVSVSLGVLEPPASQPVLQTQMSPGGLELLHVPDTGRSMTWRLRIQTAQGGPVRLCGPTTLQAHTGAGLYTAQAAGGVFDPGWRSVSDATAHGRLAAQIPGGTVTRTWRDDIFGTPTAVQAGPYDVWYRVRVANPTGKQPEMVLGLLDENTWKLLGATVYSPDRVGTSYQWVRVASGALQKTGHRVAFVAEFSTHTRPLSTDWFVDEALLLPTGSPPPSDITSIA